MSDAAPPASPAKVSAASLGTLALLFLVITIATWARWGHVRIDAGGAIYRASAIADGAVLYRDIQSHYGPLGCYAVAALFELFGTHLAVVYALGLVLLAGESILLWRIARRLLSEPEAVLSIAAFWVLLGFQPGLFDWVLPNVFASTFAVLFATATLAFLVDDLDRPADRKLVLASLCAALAGLSKIEHGGAAVGALLMYAILLTPRVRTRWRALWLALLPGAALTGMVALALVIQVPWRVIVFDNLYRVRSLGEVLGAYQKSLFPPVIPALMDAVVTYLVELPLLVAAVASGIALLRSSGMQRLAGLAVVAGALALSVHLVAWPSPDLVRSVIQQRQFVWTAIAWGAVAAWAIVQMLRGRDDIEIRIVALIGSFSLLDAVRWSFRVAWAPYYAVFAPLLILLAVRTVVRRLVPQASPWPLVLVLSVCLLVTAERHWRIYAGRSFPLQYPRGTIYTTRAEGTSMKAAIDYLRERTRPGDYVAILPEEQLINFLAETRHPTRDTGVGPRQLATQEDVDRFIAELEAKNTRFIVLSKRRYAEFGAGGVEDYNPELAAYLGQHYPQAVKAGLYRILERP